MQGSWGVSELSGHGEVGVAPGDPADISDLDKRHSQASAASAMPHLPRVGADAWAGGRVRAGEQSLEVRGPGLATRRLPFRDARPSAVVGSSLGEPRRGEAR